MPELTIFSGGQTGVDRAALDAALAAGAPGGGWCPAGRLAEDGTVPVHYPVRELAEGGYRERTRANVRDSCGTLVIHAGEIEGGTARTVGFCRAYRKPCLLIDSNALTAEAAAATVRRFVADHRIAILNVAGPRASKYPRIYDYTFALVTLVLKDGPADA